MEWKIRGKITISLLFYCGARGMLEGRGTRVRLFRAPANKLTNEKIFYSSNPGNQFFKSRTAINIVIFVQQLDGMQVNGRSVVSIVCIHRRNVIGTTSFIKLYIR